MQELEIPVLLISTTPTDSNVVGTFMFAINSVSTKLITIACLIYVTFNAGKISIGIILEGYSELQQG